MLYVVKPEDKSPARLAALLKEHPEVQFISLLAVDFGNNHTDEKIPVGLVIDDLEDFFKNGIQTDGSSVYLPEIASINNAKVDLIPDLDANWVVDYNMGHPVEGDKLCGSLIIPAFLIHDGKEVCSRSVLKNAVVNFKNEIIDLFTSTPSLLDDYDGIDSVDDIEDVVLTSATELEFWVKTPDSKTDIEKLATSQNLKEQYWKRTYGQVRTALEKSLKALEDYGFEPEMGHKEVGGVASKLSGTNIHTHVMEQLEIDWKYDKTLLSADKELLAKDIIKDVFESNGLTVTFQAKPLEGVAGSGEHHHIGAALKLKNGKIVNLFSPKVLTDAFMTKIGYGALMGILKNYEIINPFVSSTNDSLNRLKPGFEAPICIVSSLGHSPEIPTRNRTVLIGLVRDLNSKYATRFELRAPNPNSNSYLLLAAVCQASIEGIKAALNSGKSVDEIAKAFDKGYGEKHFYLEENRVYRSEEDVFEDYSPEERDRLFGTPPKTVYENLLAFDHNADKAKVLLGNNVFTDKIIASYKAYMLSEWSIELKDRIIQDHVRTIRRLVKLHTDEEITDLDIVNWEKIKTLKHYLMKDSLNTKSLFTRIKEAILDENYSLASLLQIEMNAQMSLLTKMYLDYRRNLIIIAE
ncbi:glutamine synthetase [Fusibacter bizertensis]|uniref:glutamine synthetase n=1 Tax=Fusibacter bizertensis TaxID=1488331 RepID=A0ABT6NFH1_9FIRM|nr:glutamine synthetase [Fusibacter bizertensis]MDH8679123.1 glutamine synthetase [Fusibacter bizertensis]